MKCCVMDSTSICKTLDVVYFRYKVTVDAAAGHEKKLSFGNCSRMGTYFSVRVPDLGQINRSFWDIKILSFGQGRQSKIELARSAARHCHESQSLSFRQYQLMPVTKLAASGFSAKAVRKMLCKSSK